MWTRRARPYQEAQSRKRWGHAGLVCIRKPNRVSDGDIWASPLRAPPAPSPDVRYGHPVLRSLHAGCASPSWLRLPPSPAPGHGQPLARLHQEAQSRKRWGHLGLTASRIQTAPSGSEGIRARSAFGARDQRPRRAHARRFEAATAHAAATASGPLTAGSGTTTAVTSTPFTGSAVMLPPTRV